MEGATGVNAHIGGGWRITHLTDRVCEMTRDDVAYRSVTGQDGFVRVRAEPGMDRQQMIERGLQQARKSDEKLALILSAKLMPTAKGVGRYRNQVKALAQKFTTGEESPLIGVYRP